MAVAVVIVAKMKRWIRMTFLLLLLSADADADSHCCHCGVCEMLAFARLDWTSWLCLLMVGLGCGRELR